VLQPSNTLVEAIDRLRHQPDRIYCHFYGRDGVSRASVDDLFSRIAAFSAAYGRAGPQRKLIGIALYQGLDLHAAFFAAIWSGHLPTMIAPPSPRMDAEKYARSLAGITKTLELDSMVIEEQVASAMAKMGATMRPDCEMVDASGVGRSRLLPSATVDPGETAFIQHSSGTTGLQKGVALSHRSVLCHNEALAESLGISSSDRIVSWLPLYHDMGLIACFMIPLTTGATLCEMSPFSWVSQPSLLFDVIAAEKGTLCWMPNFAFSFMASSVGSKWQGDLSSVRAWINCSETVMDDSFVAFERAFSSSGVSRSQLSTSYAMAENVFAVTQAKPGSHRRERFDKDAMSRHSAVVSPDGVILLSSGKAVSTTEIRIEDAAGAALGEGEVGEILIKGDHLFSGYFHRDDLTREAFAGNGWYRTGDLGFLMDHDLFVTGRLKDLIIVQGRNFYPADIERVAGTIDGVEPGRVVSFGVNDGQTGTESILVLYEGAEGAGSRVARQVRARLAEALDVAPSLVQRVPDRWIVKSTAGKVARGDNHDKFLSTQSRTGVEQNV
jgi:fatty-acyl-CoA synthase